MAKRSRKLLTRRPRRSKSSSRKTMKRTKQQPSKKHSSKKRKSRTKSVRKRKKTKKVMKGGNSITVIVGKQHIIGGNMVKNNQGHDSVFAYKPDSKIAVRVGLIPNDTLITVLKSIGYDTYISVDITVIKDKPIDMINGFFKKPKIYDVIKMNFENEVILKEKNEEIYRYAQDIKRKILEKFETLGKKIFTGTVKDSNNHEIGYTIEYSPESKHKRGGIIHETISFETTNGITGTKDTLEYNKYREADTKYIELIATQKIYRDQFDFFAKQLISEFRKNEKYMEMVKLKEGTGKSKKSKGKSNNTSYTFKREDSVILNKSSINLEKTQHRHNNQPDKIMFTSYLTGKTYDTEDLKYNNHIGHGMSKGADSGGPGFINNLLTDIKQYVTTINN